MGRDTRIPEENYPFATKDGVPIPLDILKPKGLIYQPFTTAPSSIEIPKANGVCYMYASEDCFVQLQGDTAPTELLPSVPAAGALTDNCIFIPKCHMMTVRVNYGLAYVLALQTAGFLTVQMITRWAGLDIDTSYTDR